MRRGLRLPETAAAVLIIILVLEHSGMAPDGCRSAAYSCGLSVLCLILAVLPNDFLAYWRPSNVGRGVTAALGAVILLGLVFVNKSPARPLLETPVAARQFENAPIGDVLLFLARQSGGDPDWVFFVYKRELAESVISVEFVEGGDLGDAMATLCDATEAEFYWREENFHPHLSYDYHRVKVHLRPVSGDPAWSVEEQIIAVDRAWIHEIRHAPHFETAVCSDDLGVQLAAMPVSPTAGWGM